MANNPNPPIEIGLYHHTLMVDHPRAARATQCYMQVFGAILVHQIRGNAGGAPNNAHISTVSYLSIGAHHHIFQVLDVIRPRIEENMSYGVNFLHVENPARVRNLATALNGAFLGIESFGANDFIYYKIRDPYGFVWYVGGLNNIPPAVVTLLEQH